MTNGLELQDIHRSFHSAGQVARAVDGVDLAFGPGEILGLVGESGCGKTTLARIAVGLDRPDRGQVLYDGRPVVGNLRAMRRHIQYVFQEPIAAFNPRRTVGGSIAQPLRQFGLARGDGRAQVAALMEQVGLDPAFAGRRPHMLSGGQLQRAAIARALALEPELLVCDEPVAALDVSVRAQILNLLLDLKCTRGLGILFVSHDLGVVRRICDRVAVMYLGRIVETGGNQAVWSAPRHPYTRVLAAAVPTGDRRRHPGDAQDAGKRPRLLGEPPSPFAIPSGCRFHPRCPVAIENCSDEDPVLRPVAEHVRVACHLAE